MFAPIGIQMPFFPLWLAGSGFSPGLIALLMGVAPVVRFVANLTIPPQADRRGDAASVLLACAMVTAVAQAFSGLVSGVPWIFALSLLATLGQGPMVPLLDTIVLREVRRRMFTQEKPLDYGPVRGVGSIAVLLLMLGSGAVAGFAPTSAIIWFITAASFAAVVCVALVLPRATPGGGITERRQSSERIPNRNRVALIIAASSAVQASHATLYAFGSIGWRQSGYSDSMIGEFWASGVATEVAFFVFAHRFARGRSLSYRYLIAGSAIAMFRWGLMAAAPGPALLLFAQLLHAGSFAATYLGAVVAISNLAGERRRAQVQGWVSAANALTLAAATMISGPLWTTFGWRAYLFASALAAVGFACACLAARGSLSAQPHRSGAGGEITEPS